MSVDSTLYNANIMQDIKIGISVLMLLLRSVQDNQQKLKGVLSVFLLYSLNYPDMFRHTNAIFRGLHFPQRLRWSNG
jgi:hypothetical protein